MGFTEPIPTPETAHLLYQSRESHDFQGDNIGPMERLKRWAAVRDARHFLRGLPPDSSILDYSCGDGAFTLAAKAVFPDGCVKGTDMHPEPPTMLRREDYLPAIKGTWNAVLLRHVLEHSYDPVGLLRYLRSLLSESGILAVEVPNLEAASARIFGEYWDNYYVPFHPVHFTRKSLRMAMEAAGFEVVSEGGAEMPKVGRSIQNALGCRYSVGLFAIGMILHPVQVGLRAITQQPTCLRIWGRVRPHQ
jgi:hypothetical protein